MLTKHHISSFSELKAIGTINGGRPIISLNGNITIVLEEMITCPYAIKVNGTLSITSLTGNGGITFTETGHIATTRYGEALTLRNVTIKGGERGVFALPPNTIRSIIMRDTKIDAVLGGTINCDSLIFHNTTFVNEGMKSIELGELEHISMTGLVSKLNKHPLFDISAGFRLRGNIFISHLELPDDYKGLFLIEKQSPMKRNIGRVTIRDNSILLLQLKQMKEGLFVSNWNDDKGYQFKKQMTTFI